MKRLHLAAQLIEDHENDKAQAILDTIPSEDLLLKTIANGLRQIDPPPLSREAYRKANLAAQRFFGDHQRQSLFKALECHLNARATFVLVGLDVNMLPLPLLVQLAKRCRELHIVDPGPKAMAMCREALEQNQILAHYHPYPVQDLPATFWQRLQTRECLVFSNFMLHFLEEQEYLAFFQQIKGIQKSTFLILERDLQLRGTPLPLALKRALDHFGPTLDALQNLPQDDITHLRSKTLRLLWDALNPSPHIVGTHLCQSAEQWKEELQKAGFSQIQINPLTYQEGRHNLSLIQSPFSERPLP